MKKCNKTMTGNHIWSEPYQIFPIYGCEELGIPDSEMKIRKDIMCKVCGMIDDRKKNIR